MEKQAAPPDSIRIEVKKLKLQKELLVPFAAWEAWMDGIYSLPWFTFQPYELRNIFFRLNLSHKQVDFCTDCYTHDHVFIGLVITTESEKNNAVMLEENSSLSASSEETIINFQYVKWDVEIKTNTEKVIATFSIENFKPIHMLKVYESTGRCYPYCVKGDVQIEVNVTLQRFVTGSSALGSPPVPGPLRARGTLQRMLASSASHDVQLTLQDGALSAHRAVLAANSDVFSAMFQHNFQESKKGKVAIPDIRVEVMRRALGFLYGEEIVMPTDDPFMCMELFVFSERYQFLALKEACENAFASSPSLNQLELLLLADSNKADGLMESMLSRLAKNPDRKKLLDENAFKKISESHPHLLQHLFKALL